MRDISAPADGDTARLRGDAGRCRRPVTAATPGPLRQRRTDLAGGAVDFVGDAQIALEVLTVKRGFGLRQSPSARLLMEFALNQMQISLSISS
jgi:hypothetical protein